MAKVVAIILNWNGLELTTTCVRQLLASSYANLDIIVLDNGSRVNEATALRERFGEKIQVERSEKNLGFAGGNNYVVHSLLAGKEPAYYLLLNQDAVVDTLCIETLVAYMENNLNVAVSGPLVLESSNSSIQSCGATINLYTGKVTSRLRGKPLLVAPGKPEVVDCIVGCCFMARGTVVREIGLFDEQYFAYYEEADWCMRARAIGKRCVVVPAARAAHSKTGGFRTYFNVRNMIWFEQKFASPPQLLTFFFYFWLVFIPERIKKGSRLRELWRAAWHGWLGLHKSKPN